MLTKYKDVKPKKDVKGPLKNVFMSAAYSEFFSVREYHIFTYFQSVFFCERIILKHIENKKGSGGPDACFLGKFLKVYML